MNTAKRLLAAISATALVAAATVPSVGQSEPDDPQADALALIVMSRQLHDRAIETSDPVLMLSAARLRKDSGMKRGEIGTPDAPDEDIPQEDVFGWEGWLDEAVRISGGSTIIAGLADDIRTSKSKGLKDGGIYTERRIPARGKKSHRALNFIGGEFALVYSEGMGDADIDMFVYDARGALVCSQTDTSNLNQCGWTPGVTGPFDVTLENKSDFGDTYALSTN